MSPRTRHELLVRCTELPQARCDITSDVHVPGGDSHRPCAQMKYNSTREVWSLGASHRPRAQGSFWVPVMLVFLPTPRLQEDGRSLHRRCGMLSTLPRTQPWAHNMRFLLHSITRILNLNRCPAPLGCLQGVVADLGDAEMDALDMDSPLPAPGPFRMAASLLPSRAQPLTCWVVSVCREDAEPAAALPGHCPLQGPLLGARPAGWCCPIAAWRASQSPGGIGGSADEGPLAVTPTCSPKVFCL